MSTLKEIIDTITAIKGDISDYVVGTTHKKSLSKESMNAVFDFPVIVSNNLTIESASLVGKALERQFASCTLTVMMMNPHLEVDDGAPSVVDFLHKFHQNIDIRTDKEDILNAVNSFVKECFYTYDVDHTIYEDDSMIAAYRVFTDTSYVRILKEHKKWNYSVQEMMDAKSTPLNDVYKPKKKYKSSLTEAGVKIDWKSLAKIAGKSSRRMEKAISTGISNAGTAMGNALGRSLSSGLSRRSDEDGIDPVSDPRQIAHMIDNDVRKANELVPTLLYVRIYPFAKKSKVALVPIDIIVGIKATLHPVSTDEVVVNMARGIKNENTFFNFLRWTTGEINFVRDFLFCVNDAKLDAINNSKETSKWWTMLKRRKSLAKIKGVILPNKLIPNATIMISKDEVDLIKREFGYNLNDTKLIYKIMENYFLIAFVIVDEALQRVQFLFDGKTEFETYTFATLARENTVDDKKFKDMIAMLGRRM